MKTVFIFGAGVSKEAGAPVMRDFLDIAHHLRHKTIGQSEVKDAFDDVFNAISELHPIHHRSYLNLNNIEEVFSAIEMAQIIGRLGSLKQERIEKLKKSIITLIVETLAKTIKFSVRDGRVLPSDSLYGFVRELNALKVKARELNVSFPDISFVTFNYDLTLDYALEFDGIIPDYCLSSTTITPAKSHCPLLKLHGSLNWLRCDNAQCKKINTINPLSVVGNERHYDRRFFNFDLSKGYNCSCGTQSEYNPILVPPTWNKSGYHDEIKNVWQKAAKVLAEAENIFVVGYSLPPTDLFFRYLFAMSADSSTWLQRFWVYNPDGEVEDRFREICGKGIIERFKFTRNSFAGVYKTICSTIENDLKR